MNLIKTGFPALFIMSFLFSGCPAKPKPVTPETPESSIAQTPTHQYPAPAIKSNYSVSVDVVAYRQGKQMGVMFPVQITVGPNTDKEPNVSISGDLSGGLGSSWRAGVWMSAYQAATSVGRDLTDYAVTSRGHGLIDGPSSSGLFTAAMMAAMMGVPVKTDFTMTGTVNPDGTIGPVGGIPNKFQAAIKKGKKVLGYPVGQRFAQDHYTKQIVDLHELAEQAGARAVETATVYDAYELLTGRTFPRPEPLPKAEMAITGNIFQSLQKHSLEWSKIFAHYGNLWREQNVQNVPEASKRMNTAMKFMQTAADLLKEGSAAAAYDFAQRGGAWAFTSYWFARFLRLAAEGKFEAIYKQILEFKETEKRVEERLQTLRVQRPATMDQMMAVISAYEQLVESWAYARNGDVLLQQTIANIKKMQTAPPKEDPRELMFRWLYDTSFKYSLAEIKQAKAGNFLGFYSEPSPPYEIDEARLHQVAKIFLAAAQANLVYFEEIFVPQFVQALGKSPDIVKNLLQSRIGKYLLATLCLRFPQFVLSEAWGRDAPETAFAQVAGSMGSYFNSSMLITKYYSLNLNIVDEILGQKKTAETVPRLKALVAMLRHAEETVRIKAALSKKHAGTVPTSAKIFYQIGMTMQEMTPALKIKALEMFWRASMLCQIAVMTAR